MAKVLLGDVVDRVKDKVDKDATDLEYYVGGEHIDGDEIMVHRKGLIQGSTIGPAFHMRFQRGDVLLMSRNPHLRKASMVDFDGICSDVSYICRTKDNDVLLQSLLPFILQTPEFWQFAEENKKGGLPFFLNWKDFARFEFELQTIEWQRQIADLLWAMERVKIAYRELIARTDDLVKSQFIEMFGTIETKGTLPRKKWKEVLTIVNGKDYKPVAIENGGFPVYGTGGEMARAKDYLCPENSVLMGRKGTIDNPILVREKFWNVDTAFGVVPNSTILHYTYLLWYCKQLDFSKLNKATTLPSTTKADLLNLEINVPAMVEQERFAAFVEQSDKSKYLLQRRLGQLRYKERYIGG